MSDFITVEPAAAARAAFAQWALANDPAVLTVGTGGFLIPLDDYPAIPPALLAGGHVDGFPVDRPAPQPVPLVELRLPVPERKPLTAENPAPRKRAPRKRAARKPKGPDA